MQPHRRAVPLPFGLFAVGRAGAARPLAEQPGRRPAPPGADARDAERSAARDRAAAGSRRTAASSARMLPERQAGLPPAGTNLQAHPQPHRGATGTEALLRMVEQLLADLAASGRSAGAGRRPLRGRAARLAALGVSGTPRTRNRFDTDVYYPRIDASCALRTAPDASTAPAAQELVDRSSARHRERVLRPSLDPVRGPRTSSRGSCTTTTTCMSFAQEHEDPAVAGLRARFGSARRSLLDEQDLRVASAAARARRRRPAPGGPPPRARRPWQE